MGGGPRATRLGTLQRDDRGRVCIADFAPVQPRMDVEDVEPGKNQSDHSACSHPMPKSYRKRVSVDALALAERHCGSFGHSAHLSAAAYSLFGFAKAKTELIRMPADRRIEHLEFMVVCWITQHVTLAIELEAGGGHLILDGLRIDPVQRICIAHPGACFGHMIDDYKHAAGLQHL